MEGLKQKIKEKEEEIAILKAQAVKEQRQLALDTARLCLPVDSMFSKDLVSINLISPNALFEIELTGLNGIVLLRSPFDTERSVYYLRVQNYGPVDFWIEIPLLWGGIDKDFNPAVLDFLGIARDDTFGASVVKVARFWSDLEAVLAIYISYTSSIPDLQRYSPDEFAREFSKLKSCN